MLLMGGVAVGGACCLLLYSHSRSPMDLQWLYGELGDVPWLGPGAMHGLPKADMAFDAWGGCGWCLLPACALRSSSLM